MDRNALIAKHLMNAKVGGRSHVDDKKFLDKDVERLTGIKGASVIADQAKNLTGITQVGVVEELQLNNEQKKADHKKALSGAYKKAQGFRVQALKAAEKPAAKSAVKETFAEAAGAMRNQLASFAMDKNAFMAEQEAVSELDKLSKVNDKVFEEKVVEHKEVHEHVVENHVHNHVVEATAVEVIPEEMASLSVSVNVLNDLLAEKKVNTEAVQEFVAEEAEVEKEALLTDTKSVLSGVKSKIGAIVQKHLGDKLKNKKNAFSEPVDGEEYSHKKAA